ncbi:MAG: SMP-30/gluconolactonase/LRE family protein [Acidobacteria bacterium]|nr:SMP-30/gluconolactonase/LRE family protein [Acidobacteriota bacterium]
MYNFIQGNPRFKTTLFPMILSAAVLAQDPVVPPNAKPEVVSTVAFTEGPAYHVDGSIYFTDVSNNRIMRSVPGPQPGSRRVLEVYRTPSGRANGLVFDLEGRLLACEGGSRRVTRTEHDGAVTVLAGSYQGKPFNSPNDIDVDAQGRLYFTDPRYGDRSGMELEKEAVYRIDPDGKVTRIIDDLERPNGIAVSPDQKTLYVVDNNNGAGGSRKVYGYELRADGSAGKRRVIHDFGVSRGGDGMCLDSRENLYVTAGLNTPNPPAEGGPAKAGIYIISPAGKQIGFIPIPEDMVTNCTFGDPDLKTLYITAGKTLFRIRLNITGHVLWPKAK